MGQYAASAQLATAASKPHLIVTSDGNVLPQVTFIGIGISATPDDKQYLFGLYYHTAVGSGGTAVTPVKCGPAASASSTAKKGTFSADPTISGVALVGVPFHHRNRATVQKAFGEGYMPATIASTAGLGIWCDVSPAAVNAEVTLNWWE